MGKETLILKTPFNQTISLSLSLSLSLQGKACFFFFRLSIDLLVDDLFYCVCELRSMINFLGFVCFSRNFWKDWKFGLIHVLIVLNLSLILMKLSGFSSSSLILMYLTGQDQLWFSSLNVLTRIRLWITCSSIICIRFFYHLVMMDGFIRLCGWVYFGGVGVLSGWTWICKIYR